MKVLLISDAVWNDSINGNNVNTNWFEGFPAEFANVYASPGLPQNNCCNRYFQVTDGMMIKGIFKGTKAGRILSDSERYISDGTKYNSTDVKGIGFMRRHLGNILRLFKTVVWNLGRYDEEQLEKFVKDFDPDIIFSPRLTNSKIHRLENKVLKYANCPIVAATGDNEYSLRLFSLSPLYWINFIYQRNCLKRNMHKYSLYYTLSAEQKSEYDKVFDVETKVLAKCGDFSGECAEKPVGNPIRIVYAGKIYAGRWKTLAEMGKVLKKVNKDGTKIVLDIYTRDKLSKRQKKLLDDGKNIFMRGGVSPEELVGIYKNADIALHVESFDLNPRYATRVSFSTKIIDCFQSSCAVMAVAWREHTGLTYLQREDAAICVDDLKKLGGVLEGICENPGIIGEYRKKAWDCGKRNHTKEKIQNMLYEDFCRVIASGRKEKV